MTPREIAEKTWELWNDYYKDGDLGSKEILDIIENDIKALTIFDVVGRSEQLKCPNCELDYDKEEIEMFRGLCESCRDRAF